MIDSQYRDEDGRKITLSELSKYMRDRFDFILEAGPVYRPEDGQEFGVIFLKAQANPYTRQRTEKIGVHNMLEMEAFLRVFGNQKVQVAVSAGNGPFVYYTMKTTKKTVEYIDVSDKPHKNPSLSIDIDLNDLNEKKSKLIFRTLFNFAKRGELFTLGRGILAGLVNHIAVTKSNKTSGNMTLPNEYFETGYRFSGWDKEAYLRAKNLK
jgi:hypothetical protein